MFACTVLVWPVVLMGVGAGLMLLGVGMLAAGSRR